MKLKNKLLIIILFFSAFLIFNNSKVRAGYTYINPSDTISSCEELSFDFANDICNSSNKSNFKFTDDSMVEDYSESNYPYTFIIKTSDNNYHISVSKKPLHFIAYKFVSGSFIRSGFYTLPSGGNIYGDHSYFTYNYNGSTFSYDSSLEYATYSSKVVAYFSNYAVPFFNPPQGAEYGVETDLNTNYLTYDNVSNFYLAECQVKPLITAYKVVEGQLFPTQVKGTIKEILPLSLMVFSALLVIYIIRSKIWRPI